MTAKDLDSSDIKKQKELDDITTCCICTDVYTDPKALPCIHTFCMKCLQENGIQTNKGPGDEMPCPICRRLFMIPSEGFPGLPKHFFIERLIQVSKVSDPAAMVKNVCTLCLEESKEHEGKNVIPAAEAYCVDCRHKLCEECCSEHKTFKVTKNHKVIKIDEDKADETLMVHVIDPNVCEAHEQKALDIYCADCKSVVCAICFDGEHKNHDGSHVNEHLDGFRKQIQNNTAAVNGCIAQAQLKMAEIMKVKEEIKKRVESIEFDIKKRIAEVKHLTDKHASCLLQSLSSERQSRLKEIQMTTDDFNDYLSNLESYNSYCQILVTKGSARDICRALPNLSSRVFELQQGCQPLIERGILEFKFSFRQCELEEFLEDTCDNLIGQIEEEGDPKLKESRKQNLLRGRSSEIDILKTEIERTDTGILQSENAQLKVNISKEIEANKALREEYSSEKANFNANTEKLKQESEGNRTTIKTLQAINDKLQKELNEATTKRNSLQVSFDKSVEELDTYKAKAQSLEIKTDELRKKLEASEADNRKKCLDLKQKLKEERTGKDHLREQTKKYRKIIDELQDNYKSDPVLVNTIRIKSEKMNFMNLFRFAIRTKSSATKKDIGLSFHGMTILDKELFVVNSKSSEVEVYDSMKFSFSRRWNLKQLRGPIDIGSCKRKKCLYILNCNVRDEAFDVLRVDPNGKLIKKWSIGDDFAFGLSVTSESNVILTFFEKNELHEYSSDGQLIREINLLFCADIRYPFHAVKLANGHFVVSHGKYRFDIVDNDDDADDEDDDDDDDADDADDDIDAGTAVAAAAVSATADADDDCLNGVSLVDADGKLKKLFGGEFGSGIGQMNGPFHLGVDGNGFVMVADRGNGRVLLLNSELEFRRVLLSTEKHGLQEPERILLDESNARLFVSDSLSSNPRILIYNFK